MQTLISSPVVRHWLLVFIYLFFTWATWTKGQRVLKQVTSAQYEHSLECYVYASNNNAGQRMIWTRTRESASSEILTEVDLESNMTMLYNEKFSFEYIQQGNRYSFNLDFIDTAPNDSAIYKCLFRSGGFQQEVVTYDVRIIKCTCFLDVNETAGSRDIFCDLGGFSVEDLSVIVLVNGKRLDATISGDVLELSLNT